MRDTPYASELARASFTFPDGSEGRIERLQFKSPAAIGYRFSWWKENRMIPRPLDATEDQLLALLKDAVNRAFSERFVAELRHILE